MPTCYSPNCKDGSDGFGDWGYGIQSNFSISIGSGPGFVMLTNTYITQICGNRIGID